jgi:hypothetical protein
MTIGKNLITSWSALMCVTCLLGSKAQPSTIAGTIYKHAARSVVAIEAPLSHGNVSMGTGFIVSADGKILTNYHVIQNSRTARVRLDDDRTFSVVSVLGIDKQKDIAVLKIDAANLEFLPLADSDDSEIGDDVYSLSNPLGQYLNTLSAGIISGIRERDGYLQIQFTAPTSHGSSGGPLFNSRGEVIAITSTGDYSGQSLNFAVPINDAREVLAHPGQSRSLASVHDLENHAVPLNYIFNVQRRQAVVQMTMLLLTCWFLARLVRRVWRTSGEPNRTMLGKVWFRFGLPALLCAGAAAVMVLEFAVLGPS